MILLQCASTPFPSRTFLENLMRTVFAVGLGLTLSTILAVAHAQQPQIPTLQVCNVTKATGTAQVQIASRADPTHSGSFTIKVNLNCDPKNPGYPAGTVEMVGISMTDSAVQGTLVST